VEHRSSVFCLCVCVLAAMSGSDCEHRRETLDAEQSKDMQCDVCCFMFNLRQRQSADLRCLR
jgi:hypothetical protein